MKSKIPSKVDFVFLYFSVVKIAEHLEGVEKTLLALGGMTCNRPADLRFA